MGFVRDIVFWACSSISQSFLTPQVAMLLLKKKHNYSMSHCLINGINVIHYCALYVVFIYQTQ